jgi:hypothetical protein
LYLDLYCIVDRTAEFRPMVLQQISPDCGLADLDAELEQFAVDAGAPQSGLARLIRRTDHGFRCSSWAVPHGVIATASSADATGPLLLA